MVFHIRCVLKHSERNLGLRGGLMKIYSRGGLLGGHPKSHNVPHRLGIGRLMSI